MENQEILKESFENLKYFEFYKFRKSFALVFLLIGTVNIFFYLLSYYLVQYNYHYFLRSHLITIKFILSLIIFISLFIILKSIKNTEIKGGKLIKYNTKLGLFLTIFFGFFSGVGDQLLSSSVVYFLHLNLSFEFVGIFLFAFVLIGLYYLEKRIYFPNESNRVIKQFCYLSVGFLFLSFLIWLFFVIQYPLVNGDRFSSGEPFKTLADIGKQELLLFINSMLCGLLILIYGILLMKDLREKERVLNE